MKTKSQERNYLSDISLAYIMKQYKSEGDEYNKLRGQHTKIISLSDYVCCTRISKSKNLLLNEYIPLQDNLRYQCKAFPQLEEVSLFVNVLLSNQMAC